MWSEGCQLLLFYKKLFQQDEASRNPGKGSRVVDILVGKKKKRKKTPQATAGTAMRTWAQANGYDANVQNAGNQAKLEG